MHTYIVAVTCITILIKSVISFAETVNNFPTIVLTRSKLIIIFTILTIDKLILLSSPSCDAHM